MKLIDDDGYELNSEFTIEPFSEGFYLIIESRGGGKDGPQEPRNPDYLKALPLLLTRLGQNDVVAFSVEVFSRKTINWASEDRRISLPSFSFPLELAKLTDVEKFRLQLCQAGAALGQKPGSKGGNPTKRLRFSLSWPAAIGRSIEEIELRLRRGEWRRL